jgi:RNA polymerase sigma factor (sigma-70 family)
MPHPSLIAFVHHIRALAERKSSTAEPDRQLLERFIDQHDGAAFALLVRRHGGLVLSVARRILHDTHAAEDIFQSTFLTLARRAASISKHQALSSWLFGVASRLAIQARVQETRRKKRESSAPLPRSVDVTEAAAWRELEVVLDEELQRLPERYRTPLVLIYFSGQTQENAARQLEWSLGTLRRRLERGKRLLHVRLLRRGVSLSIGLLAVSIAQSVAEAALPDLLVERTVQEVVRTVTAQATGWLLGMVSLSRAKIALALGLLVATGASLVVFPIGLPHPHAEETTKENVSPSVVEAKQSRVDRFGDPLPEGALTRLGTMRFRHGRGTTLAFAPDGKSVLSCGADHTLRTWDLASGRLLREQRLPSEPTTSAFVLSPDGRLLAYQDATHGSFCIWNIPRNELRRIPWLLDEAWQTGAFSPDSKIFAASSLNGSLRSWDVATGKGRNLGKSDNSILSFTVDSKVLMTQSNGGGIHLWDLSSGQERSNLVFSAQFVGAEVSPNGRAVAGWNYWNAEPDKGLQFWDAATGKPAKGWIAPRLKEIQAAKFAPDGKTIVIATASEILVWDPISGKRIRTLPGKTRGHLTFSPDGKTLAALGAGPDFDLHGTVLQIWNVETGIAHKATSAESGHLGEVSGVAFAPDGRTVASVSPDDGSVRLWEVASGRLLHLLPNAEGLSNMNQVLTFTPDGKYLLAGTGAAVVRWEVASGREVGRYPLFEPGKEDPQYLLLLQRTEDGLTLLAVSQNSARSRRPARGPGSGSGAFDLLAWDMKTGKRIRFLPLAAEDDWIGYGRFSPDGRWLALPGGGIHDAVTGKLRFRLSGENKLKLHMPVALSPDGALIAMGIVDVVKRGDSAAKEVVAVQVWEMATLLPVSRLETGGDVAHLEFTPDGRHFITAGLDDLQLWDLFSRRVVTRRPAPSRFRGSYGPSFASCLALAPNGRIAATGQHDTAILLWDLAPPRPARPAAPMTVAQREMYWKDLAGADAGRAFAAITYMADDPAQTLSMLRDRLHPAAAPTTEELNKLLADLDDENFERREAASKRLGELGELAETTLREVMRGKPTLEVRRRIEGLLSELRLAHTPEARRQLRAVRVLESIGSPEAQQVLEMLAKGTAEARLTQEVKSALRRLTRRP